MSGENDPVQRIASPSNSGRSSPNPFRARHRDEDSLLKKDKGYRRYASTVERVLSQFDTAVEEWADYITFLGRLLKALSVKPAGFTEIPHKFLVAKRLAQCLNPVLPSGVHQKTLEVYSYVFSTLGKNGLSTDLGLYLPGLSPVLSFAALSVKPNVLTVFETYIVPLNSAALRPALKSILLALLPGLEEENGDEFDRTLRVIEALKRSIGKDNLEDTSDDDQYFWQCMFLAGMTSTTRRPGALAYLNRNLPQLGSPGGASVKSSAVNGSSGEDDAATQLRAAITSVISPEPGLLIRCFCAGLQDDRPLVQRGFLDLLVTHLPLNSNVLQEKVKPEDLQILVLAATSVVARKDMSLNRRLWSWFLGPEPSTELNRVSTPPDVEVMSPTIDVVAYQTNHFETFGLQPLVDGISVMVAKQYDKPTERSKALRICLSLMDRWEIGGLVVPRIFLPAMRNVWLYQAQTASPEHKNEVLRSANMFFDGVESSLIWSEVCAMIARAIKPDVTAQEEGLGMLELVLFMITSFNIREEEMQTVHMPLVVLEIVTQLQQNLENSTGSITFGKLSTMSYALKIALKLIELVPSRALNGSSQDTTIEANEIAEVASLDSILSTIEVFYRDNKGNIDIGRPFSEKVVGQLLLDHSLALTTRLINFGSAASYTELDQITALLKTIIKKGTYMRPNLNEFLDTLVVDLEHTPSSMIISGPPFAVTAAKVAVIESIFSSTQSSKWISSQTLRSILPSLVYELWPAMSALRSKSNVEAVRALWALYTLCEHQQVIESSIATLMIQDDDQMGAATISDENARRFMTLWAHIQTITSSGGGKQTGSLRGKPTKESKAPHAPVEKLLERPLLLLLDTLEDPKSSLFPLVLDWLQSLHPLNSIFDLLISRLSVLYPITTTIKLRLAPDDDIQNEDPDGSHLCYYYLQMIFNVIQFSSNNVWDALSSRSPFAAQYETISSHQDFLVEVSLKLLQHRQVFADADANTKFRLCQVSLALLRQFYAGTLSASIISRSLEGSLITELSLSIESEEPLLQKSLMEVILAALRPNYEKDVSMRTTRHQRSASKDGVTPTSPAPPNNDSEDGKTHRVASIPPAALLDCILLGLKSSKSRPVLENWTTFLNHCLSFYNDGMFQVLLPLVGCFCDTLESLLQKVDSVYLDAQVQITEVLDPTITILLNGLEQLLATAHDVLVTTEATAPPPKSPEPQQAGFFGSMVGAFAADSSKPKPMTPNNRLTVLLCFKDAIKTCYSIWAWGDSSRDSSTLDSSALASYRRIALKLRNRTRRIFEHLFAIEALECLETLIELWQQSRVVNDNKKSEVIMSLLNVLESSRPKVTMPAIFNAIYSRTNPSALEPGRISTLTSDLSDITLASFLVIYVHALDDDTMNEIWNDCITFLKDVLANPMPHRQTLPSLVEFTTILGEKVDNTTFGEQKKLRRELGDLFIKLLTSTLTIKPIGNSVEVVGSEKPGELANGNSYRDARTTNSESFVSVLAIIVPSLSKVLPEAERVGAVSSTITTQVIAVMFRAKTFPENITKQSMQLVQALLSVPEAAKFVKKDINDAFNDPKFFSMAFPLVTDEWLQILQSWSLGDKDKMPELLSRLVPPAAPGVLGIGANSARLDADKKTQLTLRRMAVLILSATKDTYVINLSQIQEKLVDLLHATASSSPSSITRAEIYMVMRALILRFSPTHLSSLWPTIQSELYEALSLAYPTSDTDPPNSICLLQACKLLDTLLVLGIDDFQMQEWLFISDTTDAIYPTHESTALVTDLAQALDEQVAERKASIDVVAATMSLASGSTSGDTKRPLLAGEAVRGVPKEEIIDRLVRPFFRQLSIYAFESTYRLQAVDETACFQELLADLFDDTTLV